MESLLLLAAFSFGILNEPSLVKLQERPVNELSNFSQTNNYQISTPENKLELSIKEQYKSVSHDSIENRFPITKILSPSIALNNISWINSSFIEEYDPSISIKLRKAETNSGYVAMLQVSIPL